MSLSVALDNSVLGDITDKCIPARKIEDKEAIDKLIELARQGSIELGIAVTGALMEAQTAGERTRKALSEVLGGLLQTWPVIVSAALHVEIQSKAACLQKIMQDRDGIDSGIFLVSTLHTPYFLTTDYRFHRQFKNQEHRIREECGIRAQIFTPSEFLAEYSSGCRSYLEQKV